MMDFKQVDRSWTLFLDRDGVINYEKIGDYVTRWEDFRFYDGVLDALNIFAKQFGYIFIVTNQRGVSKGLMTERDLTDIHRHMLGAINAHGGRIDHIYYCIDMEDESPNRKPGPGMGLAAKKDFPKIDFSRSIMIGNTINDMVFGKNLGMHSVFISSNRPAPPLPDATTDAVYPSLLKVALQFAQ